MSRKKGILRLEFLRTDLDSLKTEFRTAVNAVLNQHTNDAVEELRSQSPKGVDSELANSWEAIAARRQTVTFDTEYKVINTDPDAFNKLFGRNAGKFPPVEPLERWVIHVLQPKVSEIRKTTFLVRRKIARKGTERSQQTVVLGFRRDMTYEPGSIVDKMQQKIEADLKKITIK